MANLNTVGRSGCIKGEAQACQYICPDKKCRAAIRLEDQSSVRSMAKYVTDADAMDLYARHPTEEVFKEHVSERENVPETACAFVNIAAQHPNIIPPVEEKGKGIKQSLDEEDDTTGSDFCCAHDADDSNSSAENDEAISYRLQAMEL